MRVQQRSLDCETAVGLLEQKGEKGDSFGGQQWWIDDSLLVTITATIGTGYWRRVSIHRSAVISRNVFKKPYNGVLR